MEFVFNYIDVFILIPFILGIYKGITRGFIITVSTFVSVLTGGYVAVFFAEFLAEKIALFLSWDSYVLMLTSFVLLFILTVLTIYFLAKLLTSFVQLILLGWLNRLLGGVFGLAKNTLIVGLIIFIIDGFDVRISIINKSTKTNSIFYYPLLNLTKEIIPKLKTIDIEKHIPKVNKEELI